MDELSKSFSVAEGMVDAEQGQVAKKYNEMCLNCSTQLLDVFCHHCGQKDLPKRQTLGELLTNFISSFWSYEGKFFRTTKFLITKPGFLPIEYNAGKRESYYHPARMYVFISFVFFLLFSIVTTPGSDNKQTVELDEEDIKELKAEHPKINIDSIFQKIPAISNSTKIVTQSLLDSIKELDRPKKKQKRGSIKKKERKIGGVNITLSSTDSSQHALPDNKKDSWVKRKFTIPENYKSVAAYDSSQNALPDNKKDSWIERKFAIREIELSQKYKNKDFAEEFVKGFLDNFSKVLFFLLPVFALLLKLLYIRRDYFYSEHLVFSIYYYNFFYLAGSIQILINYFQDIQLMEWIGNGVSLWIMLYLLFAMKRMYQQSWRKTILKFSIFGFLFLICTVIGLMVNALFLIFFI